MITIKHDHQGAMVHSSVLDDNTITDWRDQHRYAVGFTKPNYPMPATMDQRNSFITNLWLNAKHGKQERKVRRWWLAMCFDSRNYYLG